MRCNDMPPFSSSVGERKIMNHFVVISIFLLVAVRRYFSTYSLSASKRGSSPKPGFSVSVTHP